MGRLLTVLCLMPVLARSAWAQDTGTGPVAEFEALIRSGRYAEAETLSRAHLQAVRASAGAESLETIDATDLHLRALILNGRGALPATAELAQTNAIQKERAVGASDPALASSLVTLGQVLSLSAKHSEAIRVLDRAVALLDRPGASAAGLTSALDELGRVLGRAEQYDRAIVELRRSLALKESAGISGRSLALTLQSLGAVLQSKGEYPQARALIERALALHRQEGADHPDAIDSWTQWGQQLLFEGRLTESRDAYKEAADLAERTLSPDHPTLAYTLKDLGVTLIGLGDLENALVLNQRALAIVERNLGPDSLEAARYLNSVANSYQALGDYPSARALYDRGVRIARARLGERNDWVATFTHNMAMLDASLGDFAQARREHARAVAIWEAVYGRSHPFVALALASMAGVLREQGHAVEAVPMLERALAIRTSRLGPSHREVARTLASLALTEDRLGRTTRALALSQQALAIFEGIGGPPTPDRAVLLSLRGELLTRRGEFAAARAAYAAARDIRVELYGPSHPLVAEAEAGIATADAGLGDAGAAFAAAATAERVGRNHLQLILRSLPERESLNYAASRSRGLDVMLSLPFDRPGAHTDIADAVIRSRALVLDEMAARGRIWLEESRPEVAALWVALSSSRQRLANLVVKGPSDGRPEQYTALVEDARRERELAERTLAVRSAAFREEIAREEIGLDDVRQALPPRSALVAFARYDRTPVFRAATPTSGATSASAVKARPTSAIPSYIAFIVREGQSEITFVRLGSASSIDTLVSRSQAEIMNIVGADSPSEAENTYRVAGAALRRRVWDPVAEYVKGASMVFVVPDGTLNLLSLAALPVGRTGYLIDQGPVIHYLSAERDLVTSSPAAASSRGLLAVGGAAFDDATLFTGKASKQRPVTRAPAGVAVAGGLRASCGDLASLTFDPLAGTLQEVREVARLWSDSPADVLQDRGASEGAFKRAAPGHRVLHLATHGFFLGSTCLPAMGGTRAVGGLAPKRPGQSSAGIADNPLMLSGLALAGANRRAAAGPGDDDGILTAEEVAGLDLRGVEWAVLSACDTGLGEMKAGEGVFGLRRAFQIAGARTVIMSLWSVDDEATRLWMRALYEGRLKKHLSTADAMQQAGLSVLRARRARGETTHPFYWAGFVAAGDWR